MDGVNQEQLYNVEGKIATVPHFFNEYKGESYLHHIGSRMDQCMKSGRRAELMKKNANEKLPRHRSPSNTMP